MKRPIEKYIDIQEQQLNALCNDIEATPKDCITPYSKLLLANQMYEVDFTDIDQAIVDRFSEQDLESIIKEARKEEAESRRTLPLQGQGDERRRRRRNEVPRAQRQQEMWPQAREGRFDHGP